MPRSVRANMSGPTTPPINELPSTRVNALIMIAPKPTLVNITPDRRLFRLYICRISTGACRALLSEVLFSAKIPIKNSETAVSGALSIVRNIMAIETDPRILLSGLASSSIAAFNADRIRLTPISVSIEKMTIPTILPSDRVFLLSIDVIIARTTLRALSYFMLFYAIILAIPCTCTAEPTTIGVTMSEIPVFTVVIVTIAALLYCVKEITRYIERHVEQAVAKQLQALNNLHGITASEILESFDFWWSGKPSKTVRSAILKKLPGGMLGQLPDDLRDAMVDEKLNQYKSAAHHLALHAHMNNAEWSLIGKLPKRHGIRENMLENREQHEEDLNEARQHLLEAGVDVDALEKHFTPKS